MLDSASAALEGVSVALEADTDQLLKTAFAYKQTDDEEAERHQAVA